MFHHNIHTMAERGVDLHISVWIICKNIDLADLSNL